MSHHDDAFDAPCGCGELSAGGPHDARALHPSIAACEAMSLFPHLAARKVLMEKIGTWDAGTMGAKQVPVSQPTKFSPAGNSDIASSMGIARVLSHTALLEQHEQALRRVAERDEQLALNDLTIHKLMRERDEAREQLAAALRDTQDDKLALDIANILIDNP